MATTLGLSALPERLITPVDIPNPSFEDNLGWNLGHDNGFEIDYEMGYDGGSALRLNGAQPTRWALSARHSVPAITPGLYRVRGWVSTEGLTSDATSFGIRAQLDFRTIDGKRGRGTSPLYKGDTPWRQFEFEVLIPGDMKAESAELVVHRYNGTTGGEAWIDGFEIERVNEPPVEAFLLWPSFRGMLPSDKSPIVRVWVGAHVRGTPRLVVKDAAGGILFDGMIECDWV
jgi:hypothetical protein